MKEVEENGIWKVHEMITLVGTEWEQFSHTEWDWGQSGLARRAKEQEPGEIYSQTVAGFCHFLPVLLLPPCGLPGNLWRSFLCCYDLFSRLSSKTLTWKHLIHFVKSKNSTLNSACLLGMASWWTVLFFSNWRSASNSIPFVLSGSWTISRSAFLNGNVFTNIIAWRHLQPVPPSPSFLFFVFFSSPYTGLPHGSSVVLGTLGCLLTPPKWTSSVTIFGFLAALSSFLGNSFFFSMDGETGAPGGGVGGNTVAHCMWPGKLIRTRQSPTGSEGGSITRHAARRFVICGFIADWTGSSKLWLKA